MSITAEINRIARQRDGGPHVPSLAWYPSQLGGCERKAVLSHAQVPSNPLSDETARNFWLGNVVHEAVQSGLGNIFYRHELPLKGVITGYYNNQLIEATLSGRIDTYRFFPPEIVEFKTVRSKAFNYQLPQDAHVVQMNCYLAYPPEGVPAPDRGRLIYISKDGDNLGEYIIEKTQEIVDLVNAKVLRLEWLYRRYVETGGELPPPLPKVPLRIGGKNVYYKKSGKWGKAGQIKLTDDHRVLYCDYRGTGMCCGDGKKQVRQVHQSPAQPQEVGADGKSPEEQGGESSRTED